MYRNVHSCGTLSFWLKWSSPFLGFAILLGGVVGGVHLFCVVRVIPRIGNTALLPLATLGLCLWIASTMCFSFVTCAVSLCFFRAFSLSFSISLSLSLVSFASSLSLSLLRSLSFYISLCLSLFLSFYLCLPLFFPYSISLSPFLSICPDLRRLAPNWLWASFTTNDVVTARAVAYFW